MNTAVPSPLVIAAIVDWAKLQAAELRDPRVNILLRFGSPELAEAVGAQLDGHSGGREWYIVRPSSAVDAVRWRHKRPPEAPPGARILYLCVWAEGTDGHSQNAQSLADLRAVDVHEFLADPARFELAGEKRILARADEAAACFGKRSGWRRSSASPGRT
jgi:hypothetical protein